MRGSGIAQEPAAFGIERTDSRGDVSLILDFAEPEHERNRELAELATGQVYQAEFLPDVGDPATAEALWHFIDQTGIFYVQKVVHPKNPFHELAERRNRALPDDFADRLYEPSHLFALSNPTSEETAVLCDWITLNYAEVASWVVDVVRCWDPAVSLRANVERLVKPRRRARMYAASEALIGCGLLVAKRDKRDPDGSPPRELFRRGKLPPVEDLVAVS
jgi:hypothetical protein